MSNNKKLIYEHLVKANRPHSAQDVLTSFDNKIGKTAVTNALEELANDKKIIEKVYGKQKVYMALQVGQTWVLVALTTSVWLIFEVFSLEYRCGHSQEQAEGA